MGDHQIRGRRKDLISQEAIVKTSLRETILGNPINQYWTTRVSNLLHELKLVN